MIQGQEVMKIPQLLTLQDQLNDS